MSNITENNYHTNKSKNLKIEIYVHRIKFSQRLYAEGDIVLY